MSAPMKSPANAVLPPPLRAPHTFRQLLQGWQRSRLPAFSVLALALGLGLPLGLGGMPTLAQANPATDRLIEQARAWEQKGRDDLAADAWRKLLRADPKHPQALLQLGLIEARGGQAKAAQAYYERAASLVPPPAGLSELASALKLGSLPVERLAAARQQAQAGQSEAAVKEYKALLGDTLPSGPLGLEYYQTLGGTEAGWEEARRGLEELVRSQPEQGRYRLALARHLTYREPSRREGLRQLAALFASGGGDEVRSAWRQGLAWLGNNPADQALVEAYLKRFPDDAAMRERLNAMERNRAQARSTARPNPLALARQAGFQALNQGELDQAEMRFSAILVKHPNDADALGGLATLRLRQEDYAAAIELFDEAVRHGGKAAAARWHKARQSARYWQAIQQASQQRDAGQTSAATLRVREALAIDANEPAGQILLADLLAASQDATDLREAEKYYRHVLLKHPGEPAAFRGLIGLLFATGRDREANALIDALDAGSEQRIGGLNVVRAAGLLRQSETDLQRQQPRMALERLEDALLLDPANPWIRLALARVYQQLGDLLAAGAMLDHLIESRPGWTEALLARAQLLAAQEAWWEALMLLETVPPAKRSPAMVREQHRLWLGVQSQRAQQLALHGQHAQALALLEEVERVARNQPELLAPAINAWSALGEHARALELLRRIMAERPVPEIGQRIHYAALLLKARQDNELARVLQALAQERQLSETAQSDINGIIIALTLRQADAQREAGRLREAWELLLPALEASDDPRLWMALARLYNTAGEPDEALALAERIIEVEPDDIDHRLFASGVALAAKAMAKAVGHVAVALELAPDHPRVLAQAGRVEKARGNRAKAIEYFQFAQSLERDPRAFEGMPGNLALRLVDAEPAHFTGRDPGEAGDPPLPGTRPRRNRLLPIPKVGPGEASSLRREGSSVQDHRAASPRLMPIPGNLSGTSRPRTRDARQDADDRDAPARPAPVAPYPERRSDERSSAPRPGAARATASPAAQQTTAAARDWQRFAAAEELQELEERYPARDAEPAWKPPLRLDRRVSERGHAPIRLAAAPQRQQVLVDASPAQELADLERQLSPTLAAGVNIRSRSGDDGLAKLTATEAPLEARIPLSAGGTVVLRLTPTLLDAGTLRLNDPATTRRFGGMSFTTVLSPSARPLVQEDSGIGVTLAYEGDRELPLSFDLGVTPVGFLRSQAVGGVRYTEHIDDLKLSASLSRRAVTDSLLSYAGARDPYSGLIWGGVVKTGGRLDATLGDEQGGIYAGLGAYNLSGQEVLSNRLLETSLGAYWRAWQRSDAQLTLGVNFTGLGYSHNLSEFTVGHGGYFSPQRYLSLAIPAELSGRRGKLSYRLGGELGVRSFRVDAAPYFPTSATVQGLLETANASDPARAGIPSSYAGRQVSGLGYGLSGAFEYRLAPTLAFGGRLAFDNSQDYRQHAGGLYLRYAFDGQPLPFSVPPRPLSPNYPGEEK